MIGERTADEHEPSETGDLIVDDVDAELTAKAALETAIQAHSQGMDVGGRPLATGIMLMTDSDSRADLRLGFASLDGLEDWIDLRVRPWFIVRASEMGFRVT